MVKKILWVGILVMVLVFGMTVSACTQQMDRVLNGTWDNDDRDSGYIFDNGSFQFFLKPSFVTRRGTYTTNSGSINMTYTHIHGIELGLENRFYTISEFHSLSSNIASWIVGEIQQMIDSGSGTYSVVGNSLTVILYIDGEPWINTFTRR